MHRIDTEGNKNGKFYDGDPSGTDINEATVLDASWLNAVQEEICNVIGAGGNKLNKNDHTQLITAIRSFINPAITAINQLIVAGQYENEITKPRKI